MNATESTELQAASTSSEPRPRAPLWASAIATFFGTGKLRPGPGTWASAATTLLWGVVAPRLPQSARTPVAIATAAAVTAIGIPAATRVARALGKKDPSQVVIDEVAGQMIAMIGVPLNWQALLASLILFRAFDITKPVPVRQLERLPEGTGIMMDDVGAGLYALAVIQALLQFGLLK